MCKDVHAHRRITCSHLPLHHTTYTCIAQTWHSCSVHTAVHIHEDTYMSVDMHTLAPMFACTHTLLQFECIYIFTIGTLQITPI